MAAAAAAELDLLRRATVAGYHVNNYDNFKDPAVYQLERHDRIDNIGLTLKEVPIVLRRRGIRGVFPVLLENIAPQGHPFQTDHAMVVPSDFPIATTCGMVSRSDKFISGHVSHHNATNGCKHRHRPKEIFRSRVNTTASWIPWTFPQNHIDWANDVWKRSAGVINADAPNELPRVGIPNTNHDPFEPCTRKYGCWAGNYTTPLPGPLLSYGIQGVFIAQVFNADNVLEWTLFVPPGFPILRWCGLITQCGYSNDKHCSCPLCYFKESKPKFKVTDVMRMNLQYEFKRPSDTWTQWATTIVLADRAAKDGTGPNKYDVPDEPVQFEDWSRNDRRYEARMISQTWTGANYNRYFIANATGTLYERPHRALLLRTLRPGAYLLSHRRPNHIPAGILRPWMYPYHPNWNTMDQAQRREWILNVISQNRFNRNGFNPRLPRPALPPAINFITRP